MYKVKRVEEMMCTHKTPPVLSLRQFYYKELKSQTYQRSIKIEFYFSFSSKTAAFLICKSTTGIIIRPT